MAWGDGLPHWLFSLVRTPRMFAGCRRDGQGGRECQQHEDGLPVGASMVEASADAGSLSFLGCAAHVHMCVHQPDV